MDSFSLPTLPFIARYDTHSATKSPSTPRAKKLGESTECIACFSLLPIVVQPLHWRVCSHWKQNVCSAISAESYKHLCV